MAIVVVLLLLFFICIQVLLSTGFNYSCVDDISTDHQEWISAVSVLSARIWATCLNAQFISLRTWIDALYTVTHNVLYHVDRMRTLSYQLLQFHPPPCRACTIIWRFFWRILRDSFTVLPHRKQFTIIHTKVNKTSTPCPTNLMRTKTHKKLIEF